LFKISNNYETGNQKFTNGLALAYAGYTWQPLGGFYLKPWAGIGYTSKLSGNTAVGKSTYTIAPITMFATLHIGYRF
jgi:hypothetical protein